MVEFKKSFCDASDLIDLIIVVLFVFDLVYLSGRLGLICDL